MWSVMLVRVQRWDVAFGGRPHPRTRRCRSLEGDRRVGWDRPRGTKETVMLLAQRVHRSTHGAASKCLSAPPSTSRCLSSGSTDSAAQRPIRARSGANRPIGAMWPPGHGALIRNEGAVGSNPITSTPNPGGNAGILPFWGKLRILLGTSFRCVLCVLRVYSLSPQPLVGRHGCVRRRVGCDDDLVVDEVLIASSSSGTSESESLSHGTGSGSGRDVAAVGDFQECDLGGGEHESTCAAGVHLLVASKPLDRRCEGDAAVSVFLDLGAEP